MKVQLVYLVRNMRTKAIKSVLTPIVVRGCNVQSLCTFASLEEAEAYRLSLNNADEYETIERSI